MVDDSDYQPPADEPDEALAERPPATWSSYLDFEQPLVELEQKVAELRQAGNGGDMDISGEVNRLQKNCMDLRQRLYNRLNPWQMVQMARHPKRPRWSDYRQRLFTDFEELHGDRQYADDCAIIGGIARFDNHPVMVLGQEKGVDTESRLRHNYGMPKPEGYRKARRLMRLADRFKLPILCFIDTPGAYPGVEAEERGQSEAIAGNLSLMASLSVPTIAVVIGEGGSGGALALALADRVCMQQHAVYSVISPEGCASILWRDAAKAQQAAEQLGLTSMLLKEQNFIDRIIPEPVGGAHWDVRTAASNLRSALKEELNDLLAQDPEQRFQDRHRRYLNFGYYSES